MQFLVLHSHLTMLCPLCAEGLILPKQRAESSRVLLQTEGFRNSTIAADKDKDVRRDCCIRIR